MEKVTFNNMVELRAFCLGMAIKQGKGILSCNEVVDTAEVFKKYIMGKATLPEYTNPNTHLEQIIDVLSKSAQSINGSSLQTTKCWDEILKSQELKTFVNEK